MSNLSEMYTSLKRNPDNKFFLDLIKLLEFKLDTSKTQLVKAVGVDEFQKIQGRALELTELLQGLQRKPVHKQPDGAFGQ
jgi:hypothetical protein